MVNLEIFESYWRIAATFIVGESQRKSRGKMGPIQITKSSRPVYNNGLANINVLCRVHFSNLS